MGCAVFNQARAYEEEVSEGEVREGEAKRAGGALDLLHDQGAGETWDMSACEEDLGEEERGGREEEQGGEGEETTLVGKQRETGPFLERSIMTDGTVNSMVTDPSSGASGTLQGGAAEGVMVCALRDGRTGECKQWTVYGQPVDGNVTMQLERSPPLSTEPQDAVDILTLEYSSGTSSSRDDDSLRADHPVDGTAAPRPSPGLGEGNARRQNERMRGQSDGPNSGEDVSVGGSAYGWLLPGSMSTWISRVTGGAVGSGRRRGEVRRNDRREGVINGGLGRESGKEHRTWIAGLGFVIEGGKRGVDEQEVAGERGGRVEQDREGSGGAGLGDGRFDGRHYVPLVDDGCCAEQGEAGGRTLQPQGPNGREITDRMGNRGLGLRQEELFAGNKGEAQTETGRGAIKVQENESQAGERGEETVDRLQAVEGEEIQEREGEGAVASADRNDENPCSEVSGQAFGQEQGDANAMEEKEEEEEEWEEEDGEEESEGEEELKEAAVDIAAANAALLLSPSADGPPPALRPWAKGGRGDATSAAAIVESWEKESGGGHQREGWTGRRWPEGGFREGREGGEEERWWGLGVDKAEEYVAAWKRSEEDVRYHPTGARWYSVVRGE